MAATLLGSAPNLDRALLTRLEQRSAVSSKAARIEVISPVDEETIGSVPESTAEEAASVVARSRRAQHDWAAVAPAERARVLLRFHDLLIDRADVAMDIIQIESGKARIPAFEEVYDTVATTRYYAKTGPRLLAPRRRAVSLPGFTKAWERRLPVGVVGNITPWNFPLTLSISDAVPALLAGNSVVVKPDEKTPYSALYASQLLDEAGLPHDVLQVITGRGDIVGAALVDEVDFIAFTGSTGVGRQISERAGRRLVSASMELGGKNAALVLADADLEKTVPGVSRAVYANGGQLCIAMERIYVDESIRDEFTAAFVEHTRGLRMSTAFDYSSDIGSMISREHMETVHQHVEDAVDRGATLLTGGKARPDVGPLFYEPTVLTDVDDSMLLCRAETFGPVVSIYGFTDIEEAVAAVNDSEYGLNHSVWTSDSRRGVELASRLAAGTVGVNDGYAAAWSSFDAPMGGMRSSGISRRHGRVGLLKYTESQTIAVQRVIPAFAPPAWLGYHAYQRLLAGALKVLKRVPFYK